MGILLALADVGAGVQFEEALGHAGLEVKWDRTQADGPHGTSAPSLVVLDADYLGPRLVATAEAWRDHPALPGLIALGGSAVARAQAQIARVPLVAPSVATAQVVAALREAGKLRHASGLRWPILRAAVGLPHAADVPAAWGETVAAARHVDSAIPRAALRWHVQHYATPTARMQVLSDERVLVVPELEVARRIDGTATVQTVVRRGPLDPVQSARLVWALASLGAIALTPEVHDIATPARRRLGELRAHLRARGTRLERSTFYDVLEITPLAEAAEIENAYRAVGQRFSPQMLGQHDLGELAAAVTPAWELVEKARGVLGDHAARGRYHDWLREKLPELRTIWAIDPDVAQRAIDAYARGQASLGDGDAHRAMRDVATACRHHPGHPDYEATLAWVRYRVQVDSGRDRVEAAVAERRTVENLLLGCRAWPQALVALALLCLAGGDAESARWHLHVALSVAPNLAAATQLAARLGMRR